LAEGDRCPYRHIEFDQPPRLSEHNMAQPQPHRSATGDLALRPFGECLSAISAFDEPLRLIEFGMSLPRRELLARPNKRSFGWQEGSPSEGRVTRTEKSRRATRAAATRSWAGRWLAPAWPCRIAPGC
jgi:hypothetical protein